MTRDMPEADTISLAKNTNKLRVVLQNVMGEDMDVNNFSFRIVADNGYMDYDNSLLQDPTITTCLIIRRTWSWEPTRPPALP